LCFAWLIILSNKVLATARVALATAWVELCGLGLKIPEYKGQLAHSKNDLSTDTTSIIDTTDTTSTIVIICYRNCLRWVSSPMVSRGSCLMVVWLVYNPGFLV
jgi:hypothetical protein